MRIAQVAPLAESVPPKFYGGTERVVSYLTDALADDGHEVTLYASGDSRTKADLRPVCDVAMRLNKRSVDPIAPLILMMERVLQDAHRFDIIHFHIDYLHFPLTRRCPVPSVTTLHGRLDVPELIPLYDEFRDRPVVSISDAQRAPLPHANWAGTVHHGLPTGLYTCDERPGRYAAFVGRMSPEKRVDRAIRIAAAAGVPLKIAAKVDRADHDYFKTEIEPLLDGPHVQYLGELGDGEKRALLAGARALLFPVEWPEPFGLVMIEAMACGTPVIAFNRGAIPEVIEDGVNGFVVESEREAAAALARVDHLDRRQIRRSFERRFSARRMARDYADIYRTLLARASWHAISPGAVAVETVSPAAPVGATVGRSFQGDGLQPPLNGGARVPLMYSPGP